MQTLKNVASAVAGTLKNAASAVFGKEETTQEETTQEETTQEETTQEETTQEHYYDAKDELSPPKPTLRDRATGFATEAGKAVFGRGTVEDMQKGLGDDKTRGMKGLGKAGIVLAVMITVGVLATGPFGPLIAAVLAIGAGIATPKIASALGFKGMEFSQEERQEKRIAQVKPSVLKAKKKELEESASQKKKIGIAAISIGVLVAFLTGGTAIPLLLGALAIGCGSLYSSSKDRGKAIAIGDINDETSIEVLQNAAQAAGIIKAKDLDALAKKYGQNIRNAQVNREELDESTTISQNLGSGRNLGNR